MRSLTLGLGLLVLSCSEKIELFPRNACPDASPADPACCTGRLDADGTLRPCGCLAVCGSDSDCATGRCDAAIGLCTNSAGSCSQAADCARLSSGVRGWVCSATAFQ